MNGERVGVWATRPSGPEEFHYAQEWLASEGARPISLSMPLRPTAYKGEVVSAYFDNLLPDSKPIRQRLQRRFGVKSARPFDLLGEIGRDCAGAIQLLDADAGVPDVRRIECGAMTRKEVGQHLRSLLQVPLGQVDADDFRISLAGAQEKAALLFWEGKWMRPKGTTPTTHILKLPIGTGGAGIDLSTSVENEWLCAKILRAFGIPAAECRMDQFESQKVLVVKRFDRRVAADGKWIIRLPVEDLCQATGVAGGLKYESEGGPGIQEIMTLLLGSSRASEDRRDFFKTQMLFWMLCAIDGHAKNFSLFLEAGGAYRLTPRYDVLSAFPVLGTSTRKLQPRKVKMAMAVEGMNRHYLWYNILPRHWMETARICGIAPEFESLRQELVAQTDAVIESVTATLPKDFAESVAEPIFAGLRKSADKLATLT